jgi:uncharacterized protein YdhG (YjbR/CyaY superfamily)
MTERGPAAARPLSASAPLSDYLATLDSPDREALGAVVVRAIELVPGADEGRTYGMPGLTYRGRPLLSVRRAAQHLGVYPFSADVVDSVAADLGGYDVSKGTIRFSAGRPLPAGIVDRIVLGRRDEIDAALDR